MIQVINSYHVDYWIRNKIIDCSSVIPNNQLNISLDDSDLSKLAELAEIADITELADLAKIADITELADLENHLFRSEFNTNCVVKKNNNKNNFNNKEKLNNNYKNLESNIVNESNYKYNEPKDNGDSKFNKSNRKRTNTEDKYRKGNDRIKVIPDRVFIKQSTNKHISLHQKTDTSINKGAMQTLPKNSRIHEFKSRERVVLLDTFTRPKLS